MSTIEQKLTKLRTDLNRTVTALDLEEGTNFTDIAGMAENGDISISSEVPEEKDVNFYDYDGELLYGYTQEEFLALEELPSPKPKNGLDFQSWNWQLTEAKTHVGKYKYLDIGAHRITHDGSTYITFTLGDFEPLTTSIYFKTSIASGFEIDWGDDTEKVTSSNNTNYNTYEHTYPSLGTYTIRLKPIIDNCLLHLQSIYVDTNLSCGYIFKDVPSTGSWASPLENISMYLNSLITDIKFGANVRFNDGQCLVFKNALPNVPADSLPTTFALSADISDNISTIVIPRGTTTISSISGPKISRICFSPTITSITGSIPLIGRVVFPDSLTSISSSSFLSTLNKTTYLYIPDSVTNFTISQLGESRSLRFIRFSNNTTKSQYLSMPYSGYPNLVEIYLGGLPLLYCNCLNSILKITSYANLTSIPNITNSGNQFRLLDLSNNTTIPTTTQSLIGGAAKYIREVLIPESLYDEWVKTGNWNILLKNTATYSLTPVSSQGARLTTFIINLTVDSGLSDTSISAVTYTRIVSGHTYTLLTYSDITTEIAEENLAWSDGTNTYALGDSVTLTGDTTFELIQVESE